MKINKSTILIAVAIVVGSAILASNSTSISEIYFSSKFSKYEINRDSYGKGTIYFREWDPACWQQHYTDQNVAEMCSKLNHIEYDIKEVFKNLPPVPEDFARVKGSIILSKKFNLENVSKDYWIQPEFTGDLVQNCMKIWKSNNPNQWYPFGITSYISEQTATGYVNQTATVYLIVGSGCGVETTQSFWIKPESDLPVQVITSFDNLPQGVIVLGPMYPEISPDWATVVKLKIFLSKPGTHTVYVYAKPPPADVQETLSQKYPMLMRSFIYTNVQIAKITVNVLE